QRIDSQGRDGQPGRLDRPGQRRRPRCAGRCTSCRQPGTHPRTGGAVSRVYLPDDWFAGGIPSSVRMGHDVYIDTSYAFAACQTEIISGVILGDAAGVYDRTSFWIGRGGQVEVGAFTCLNATTIVCHERIDIGAHCLLAWGVVVTDTWAANPLPVEDRRAAL